VYLKIAGRMVYLWRAVDAEGEVLDVLVQSKRNKPAALKLMRKLLKKHRFAPDRVTTDRLPSYSAAARELGLESRHRMDRWANNRAENSHQPTAEGNARCSGSRAPDRPEISLHPRRRLQRLQQSAPPHNKTDVPNAPL
jgi:transposase-like protein